MLTTRKTHRRRSTGIMVQADVRPEGLKQMQLVDVSILIQMFFSSDRLVRRPLQGPQPAQLVPLPSASSSVCNFMVILLLSSVTGSIPGVLWSVSLLLSFGPIFSPGGNSADLHGLEQRWSSDDEPWFHVMETFVGLRLEARLLSWGLTVNLCLRQPDQ